MLVLLLSVTAANTKSLTDGLIEDQLTGLALSVAAGTTDRTQRGKGYVINWKLQEMGAPGPLYDPVAVIKNLAREYPGLSIGIVRDIFLAGARCACQGRDLPVELELAVHDDSVLR